MKDNNFENLNSNSDYIKSIMIKSEISFKTFSLFFYSLAIYSFVRNVFLLFISQLLYNDDMVTDNYFNDIFIKRVVQCSWKLVTIIPIIILIIIFRKKIVKQNEGISILIFDIILFIFVFCDSIFPLIITAISNEYDVANLFSLFAVSLCMVMYSVFISNKVLKLLSYFYTAIPLIFLLIGGTFNLYVQFNTSLLVIGKIGVFSTHYLYIQSILYTVYPVIGYCILAKDMNKQAKRNN